MNAIETVANTNETSKLVFKALSEKQRARQATDLTRLFNRVVEMDKSIGEKEFLMVFKQLAEAKVGSLIIGRRNNHNRFIWNYNLREVAQAAQGKLELKEVSEVKKSVKKKRSAPAAVTQLRSEPPVQLTIPSAKAKIQVHLELDPSMRVEDVQALVDLVNSLQNKK